MVGTEVILPRTQAATMSRLTDQLVTAVTELEKIYQSRFVPAVVENTDRLSAPEL